MTALYKDIEKWLLDGNNGLFSHLLVVCDTFNYENYPVYVLHEENVEDYISKYDNPKTMCRIEEIYNYSMDLEQQLTQGFTYNYKTPLQKK
jgi:hypothetical protein